jgi:hypothetical protein
MNTGAVDWIPALAVVAVGVSLGAGHLARAQLFLAGQDWIRAAGGRQRGTAGRRQATAVRWSTGSPREQAKQRGRYQVMYR